MTLIAQVLTSGMVSNPDQPDYQRLQVETLTINQQYIVNGFGWYFEWIELAVSSLGKVYAEFTVPAGFFMALDYREGITNKEAMIYRVYPVTAYSSFTPSTGINARNLRNDATLTYPNIAYKGTPTGLVANGQILTVPIFGSGSGGSAQGDVASDNTFRLLAPGSKFLLELENQSNQAAYAQVNLVFGLLPESAVPPSRG